MGFFGRKKGKKEKKEEPLPSSSTSSGSAGKKAPTTDEANQEKGNCASNNSANTAKEAPLSSHNVSLMQEAPLNTDPHYHDDSFLEESQNRISDSLFNAEEEAGKVLHMDMSVVGEASAVAQQQQQRQEKKMPKQQQQLQQQQRDQYEEDERQREVTRDLVKKFISDIWNRGELELISRVCSPKIRFNGNNGLDKIGHEGFARMVATIHAALSDYHCEIHSMVVESNKAFCRLRFSGKHTGNLLGYKATGNVVSWMGATEFTCAKGQIMKVWELGDMKTLEEQLQAR